MESNLNLKSNASIGIARMSYEDMTNNDDLNDIQNKLQFMIDSSSKLMSKMDSFKERRKSKMFLVSPVNNPTADNNPNTPTALSIPHSMSLSGSKKSQRK